VVAVVFNFAEAVILYTNAADAVKRKPYYYKTLGSMFFDALSSIIKTQSVCERIQIMHGVFTTASTDPIVRENMGFGRLFGRAKRAPIPVELMPAQVAGYVTSRREEVSLELLEHLLTDPKWASYVPASASATSQTSAMVQVWPHYAAFLAHCAATGRDGITLSYATSRLFFNIRTLIGIIGASACAVPKSDRPINASGPTSTKGLKFGVGPADSHL